MKTIIVERTINVPLEKVWAVISSFEKSPGPSISLVIEKEGDPKSNWVGLERTITFRNSRAYERIESVDPPNSFTYKILSGAPVKSYLGRAEFKADGINTIIKWSGEFIPKIPGTGWLIGIVAAKNINQVIDELANVR